MLIELHKQDNEVLELLPNGADWEAKEVIDWEVFAIDEKEITIWSMRGDDELERKYPLEWVKHLRLKNKDGKVLFKYFNE